MLVSSQLMTQKQLYSHITQIRSCISPTTEITEAFCKSYFATYHHAFPFIDKESFKHRLASSFPDGQLEMLFLGVILISQLSPTAPHTFELEQLHPLLKGNFSLQSSTDKLSVELIQTGLLLASWEYTQDRLREAWMTIGVVVRMAQALRLHETVSMQLSSYLDDTKKAEEETKRCVWWCVVIIER
jgi:hypothetical protein